MAAKPKPTTARKAAPQPVAPAGYRVRIRMYQQGLGDCFLLSFRKPDGHLSHVLIDCGVVLGTAEPGAVMTQVAQDIKAVTAGTLDVLVITHEHWDHLSGFDASQARAVFNDITVKQLWLAWTEDERNPLARQLRAEREKKKQAAALAIKTAGERGLTRQAERMSELLGLFGAKAGATAGGSAGDDAGGTAGALAYLRTKKCPPTILPTGGKPLSVPGVDGVRIYVLGPPEDREALKRTDPSRGEGYELGGPTIGLADAFLAAFEPGEEKGQPFAASVRKPLAELATRWQTAGTAGETVAGSPMKSGLDWYAHPSKKWRSIDDAWLNTGERLALQLDNATNNTSLVLAFEFEGNHDVLLFVGDAQAGNWRTWDDYEWQVKEKDGQVRQVTAADLLARAIFYKVGHHGSHNATLREQGLERMTSPRLAAVIPVDTKVAHEVKGWTHMPLPAIQKRLEEKCAVIFQSDEAPVVKKPQSAGPWEISAAKFAVRMKNDSGQIETVRQQNLYTDYYL